jgi:C_GCAxxG_C_C family probable redox protein
VTDEMARITQLKAQGFHCSQILIILGLERQGKHNADLVRAMTGLANGIGNCGKICGVLTGAVCLLGLYAGRGELEDRENHLLDIMVQQLVAWFEEKFAANYGGIDCQSILNDDPWNRMLRCPGMVTETYWKVIELLEENRFITVNQEND